jgi:glycosidase
MRVILDLVYFHCGPGAVFLEDHPEFVVHNADGEWDLGSWRFPKLDLNNPDVREYLYRNMEHLLTEYDVDGFRGDVADCLPVDFWEEGRRRMEAIKPDGIMLCEGLRGDDQHEAFDFSYGFYTQWAIRAMLKGEKPASELQVAWNQEQVDYPRGFRWMRCFDNHDYAMDTSMSGGRHEARHGSAVCDTMLATIFMLNGVPMIYNGQEVADNMPHSIYANRDHGRMFVNWARALTAVGRDRLELIRQLTLLRHGNPGLMEGPLEWLETSRPESVYAFRRKLAGGDLCLVANLAD